MFFSFKKYFITSRSEIRLHQTNKFKIGDTDTRWNWAAAGIWILTLQSHCPDLMILNTAETYSEVATGTCSIKEVFLKNLQSSLNNTCVRACFLIKSDEFCEVFKNTYFVEHLRKDCFYVSWKVLRLAIQGSTRPDMFCKKDVLRNFAKY